MASTISVSKTISRSVALLGTVAAAAFFSLFAIKDAEAVACPIVIDLNGNGKIDVTSLNTSRQAVFRPISTRLPVRVNVFNQNLRSEWIEPNTDGILYDYTDGLIDEEFISFSNLIGNSADEDGFQKLKKFDLDNDGLVSGNELSFLRVWVDNGDARAEDEELYTLQEIGISYLSTTPMTGLDRYGKDVMFGYARTGENESLYMEDVWFLTEWQVDRLTRLLVNTRDAFSLL